MRIHLPYFWLLVVPETGDTSQSVHWAVLRVAPVHLA